MISVVIPTVQGREDHLERCLDAYQMRSVHPLELITIWDQPTCGRAWNLGAAQATGGWLHFTADDLEPLPSWDIAAINAVECGVYPAARIDRPDGSTQWWGSSPVEILNGSDVRAGWVPFMTRAMWDRIGPSLDIHYCTDDWLSWRAAAEGFPNIYTADYSFIHHGAQPGRGAGMTERQRRTADARVFERAMHEFTKGR